METYLDLQQEYYTVKASETNFRKNVLKYIEGYFDKLKTKRIKVFILSDGGCLEITCIYKKFFGFYVEAEGIQIPIIKLSFDDLMNICTFLKDNY